MEHCAQHRRREPQPRRQKTERCALLRGRGRNRTAKGERDLNELPIYKRCRSPFPGEHATHRTFRGRVAVPTLTSGQQPVTFYLDTMKPFCDTAGSRTLQRGKTSQKLATLRAVSACVVTTWRGKSIHNLFNEKNRGEWGVEPRSTQESRNRCSPYCTASHDGCRKHYYQSSMR